MSVEVAAAAVGAGAALIGATVAGGVSVWIERIRSKAAVDAARRDDLLRTCAEFTGAITRVRSYSYRVGSEAGLTSAIAEALDQARVECERLRLIVESKHTQQAARLVLRHAYAVWKKSATGTDPRAGTYPGTSPSTRLRSALTELYIGVRRETGAAVPEDVFEDLQD